ncbi:hypothetical protein L596_003539 [Steinernema carpocapsae]|uniref:DNA mismatch repair protein n=1 Tax=Steinernema carpocapsae TaxID=34508 RepID=A0A4V6I812_STECR|nr:hypothetical protein L596_003539 [Steinernema carpocapsae]
MRQTNLHSFFGGTPKTPQQSTEAPATPKSTKGGGSTKENVAQAVGRKRKPYEEDSPLKSVNKRKRVMISSDEDDDYEPEPHDMSSDIEQNTPQKKKNRPPAVKNGENSPADLLSEECSSMSINYDPQSLEDCGVTEGLSDKEKIAAKKVSRAAMLIQSFTPTPDDFGPPSSEKDSAPLVTKTKPKAKATPKFNESSDSRFPHLYDPEFYFLKDESIKDSQGRKKVDPEYDARTLFVPDSFLKKQTPGHKQWWAIKSQIYDTVLFFKVGKFYELYHMDAVIGVEVLNLVYMRGKFAHAGFPEVAYGRYADQLVNCGYKVARIEQTETPQQLEERCRASKVKDKVVKREVCRLTTQATRTYGVLDAANEADSLDVVDSSASYFIAISEISKSDACGVAMFEYGVCITESSTGSFILSQFTDDECRSYLRTILAQHPPLQVVYEKGHSSNSTQNILASTVGHCQKEGLAPRTEFYTSSKTLEVLCDEDYFGSDLSKWPACLVALLEDDATSGGILKSKSKYSMAISALGATMWYLKRCLVDVDLITMKNFTVYDPSSPVSSEAAETDSSFWKNKRMILDCAALTNLNLVGPLDTRRQKALRDPTALKYSLYNTINSCSTAFGKRNLRVWVCNPLCDPEELTHRQDAIAFLSSSDAEYLVQESKKQLRHIPDLERLLQKIHTLGLKYRTDRHPDGRAVLFDMLRYNKRKICDLVNTLKGFQQVLDVRDAYLNWKAHESSADVFMLESCVGDGLVDISADLQHFQDSFNQEEALKEGIIVPRKGMDAEYDSACQKVADCIADLEKYLREQQKQLKCSGISFYGTGKNRYTLEIPDSVAACLNDEYELKSQRKGFRRFTTSESELLFTSLLEAEDERDKIRLDLLRRVFADFDSRKLKWAAVIRSIATFDCLLSLADYVKSSTRTMTRPDIVFNSNEVFIEITQGYHPSLDRLMASKATSYIPNDTKMGTADPLTVLLTGPNMGGKSTLMRQVGVLIVLAQMGCLVPALTMRFTPVDRVFTRIGASDRILSGQSTFYVELNEARTILLNATKHSFVIMDELGRGTSTYDGTAIATAVLKYIGDKLRCRCFFSTHYLSLCTEVSEESNIGSAHMACVVENENNEDPTMEDVTFLYTVSDGICPKSYGFYAAKIAGIPADVVRSAYQASSEHGIKNTNYAKLRELRKLALDGSVPVDVLLKTLRLC